jgi:hypothetical protein
MGDSAALQPGGATPRRGRPNSLGSSVLTPPTGIPSMPDLDARIPAQRALGDRRPSTAPPAVVEPCACGHGRAAHDHYRRGTDCGACGAAGCSDFRPQGGAVRRTLRRIGLVP